MNNLWILILDNAKYITFLIRSTDKAFNDIIEVDYNLLKDKGYISHNSVESILSFNDDILTKFRTKMDRNIENFNKQYIKNILSQLEDIEINDFDGNLDDIVSILSINFESFKNRCNNLVIRFKSMHINIFVDNFKEIFDNAIRDKENEDEQ